MKVEDLVSKVSGGQRLSIDVIMQEDVDGVPETYCMNWNGNASEIPLSITKTDIRSIMIEVDCDGDPCDCFHIISEM